MSLSSWLPRVGCVDLRRFGYLEDGDLGEEVFGLELVDLEAAALSGSAQVTQRAAAREEAGEAAVLVRAQYARVGRAQERFRDRLAERRDAGVVVRHVGREHQTTAELRV